MSRVTLQGLTPILFLVVVSCAPRPDPSGNEARSANPPSFEAENRNTSKVLAEGANAELEEPFFAVLRDIETYSAFRAATRAPAPELSPEFFAGHAIIAVFLGTRPTPGYAVEIASRGRGEYRVTERGPLPGAILAQVLTSPYQIAAVPVERDTGVFVTLDEGVARRVTPYRVLSGEFQTVGGIAGRTETFRLEGEIRTSRREDLATLIFDLKSASGEPRTLKDTVTGRISQDGRLTLPRVNAGSFIPPPCRTLRAHASFAQDGPRISLDLDSVPCGISDSFEGHGKLEAVAGRGGRGDVSQTRRIGTGISVARF